SPDTRRTALICTLLATATLISYWPLRYCDFIIFDDPDYVLSNPNVKSGLTWSNVLWAFTTNHSANWHPLAWVSHMLDCQWFALNPCGHHLTSLLFHISNSLLLLLLFKDLTSRIWPSTAVATAFALHPSH